MYLPLHEGAELTAALAEDVVRPGPLPSLGGLRVLLIDDQQDAREALATLLGQVHAEVGSAGSGDEAIAQLEAWGGLRRPHAVVCDIALPDEDGYAILQRIRGWERRHLPAGVAQVPAIALTALPSPTIAPVRWQAGSRSIFRSRCRRATWCRRCGPWRAASASRCLAGAVVWAVPAGNRYMGHVTLT